MSIKVHATPNASTFAVWQWPEFKAFIARLGGCTERVTDMTINLPSQGMVTITVSQQATDRQHEVRIPGSTFFRDSRTPIDEIRRMEGNE
jgi:hypothetical protein